MKKFISVLLMTIFGTSICLTGCSSQEDTTETISNIEENDTDTTDFSAQITPEETKIALTLNEVAHSIFYAPMYVAIEEGYFAEEGIDLTLETGYGADKTMTAVLSGDADIGFMGSEASIYAYLEGANDPVVNFAQLTQRAGNFLVAREADEDFQWSDLKGKEVLGGRKGGMPQMVFEYILKNNGIDPATDLSIDQSIDFGSTAAAFSGGKADYTVDLYV